MDKNVGNADRIVRAVVGVALVVAAVLVGGWVWVAGVVGIVLFITAVVSTCPIYLALGLSSRKKEA